MKNLVKIPNRVALTSLLLLRFMAQAQHPDQSCAATVDSVDPAYGGRIRQMVKPDGHEHNLYYYRNPWNADSTLMVGVHSDLEHQNWRVVLYTADGCFIKDLFPISQFDWKIVWDLHDPHTLYTLKGNELYRFNVTNGDAELIKSFAPLNLKPNGPSVNQAGDRILMITSDGVFRSYRLPDMDDERTFSLELATPAIRTGIKSATSATATTLSPSARMALPFTTTRERCCTCSKGSAAGAITTSRQTGSGRT